MVCSYPRQFEHHLLPFNTKSNNILNFRRLKLYVYHFSIKSSLVYISLVRLILHAKRSKCDIMIANHCHFILFAWKQGADYFTLDWKNLEQTALLKYGGWIEYYIRRNVVWNHKHNNIHIGWMIINLFSDALSPALNN